MSHFTRQTLSIVHVIFFGFFFLWLVIGFPTLFLGCNPDVDNMCLTYDVVEATTYGIRNETKICQDCVSRQCGKNTCTDCGDPYTCYRGIVQLNYGDSNDNCEYNDRKKKFNTAQARDDYYNEEYPLGSTHNFLVKERGVNEEENDVPACTKMKFGMATWTVGVVFICIAGATLLGWIVFGFATYSSWKANITYPAPPRYQGFGNGTYVPNSPSPYTPVNTQVEMVSASSNSPYPAVTTVTPYPSVNAYPTSTAQRPVSVPITPTIYSTTPVANNSSPYNPQYTPTHVAVSAVGAGSAVNAAVRPQSTPLYPAVTAYPASTTYQPSTATANISSVAPHNAYEEYDMY